MRLFRGSRPGPDIGQIGLPTPPWRLPPDLVSPEGFSAPFETALPFAVICATYPEGELTLRIGRFIYFVPDYCDPEKPREHFIAQVFQERLLAPRPLPAVAGEIDECGFTWFWNEDFGPGLEDGRRWQAWKLYANVELTWI